jgi:hypothetical protein
MQMLSRPGWDHSSTIGANDACFRFRFRFPFRPVAYYIARPLPKLVQRYNDRTSRRFAGDISREWLWPFICASVEIMTFRKFLCGGGLAWKWRCIGMWRRTWYSVLRVTTAASWARTIVSQARMTPSFVSVESLSASRRRIKLPCNKY